MSNQRISPRFPADLPARLGLGFASGQVVDLSATGARVETHEWLAPGRRCTIQIGAGGPRVSGVVAHCRIARIVADGADRRSVYAAGIAFDLAAPGARQHVEELVAELVEPATTSRILHAVGE